MERRDGQPQWVASNGEVKALIRADLGSKSDGGFDEKWLQDLLHAHPKIFPIKQIESAFDDLIPLCIELPLTFGAGKSGNLDNLYVTADGGLVLIEAKLWRNPEARRTVVAQAIEYASALFRLSYEDLEMKVLRARGADGVSAKSLFEIVSAVTQGLDEAGFVDAVSQNLKRGRAVIAVVGDGIREDIEPLAALLQSHAGHRFTFALVELAVYDAPQEGARIVFPSVLAKTVLIERGVIKIDDTQGAIRVMMPEAGTPAGAGRATSSRPFGIGEDEFLEVLDRNQPGLAATLKAFLSEADQLGVYPDVKAGLTFKHASPLGQPLNLGGIDKQGFVDTSLCAWWNRQQWGLPYVQALADCIDGKVIERSDSPANVAAGLRTAAGKLPKLSDLLPAHQQAWLDAMARYIHDFSAAHGA